MCFTFRKSSNADEFFFLIKSLLLLKETPTGCQKLCVNYALQLVYSRGCHAYMLVCTAPLVKVFISKQNSCCWNKLSNQSGSMERDALQNGAESHRDRAAVRTAAELWRGYGKYMVEQVEASLLGLLHFNILYRNNEEGWNFNLSHYIECSDKLFNKVTYQH